MRVEFIRRSGDDDVRGADDDPGRISNLDVRGDYDHGFHHDDDGASDDYDHRVG